MIIFGKMVWSLSFFKPYKFDIFGLTWWPVYKCYLEHYATLIERNILKDSNYCFHSLLIRLWSKELKHLILRDGLP